MVRIAPVLLPQLYRIFVTTGQYSNRARSRAVVIFTTCVNVIIEISEVEKVRTALTCRFMCRVYSVICCMVSSLSCLIGHVNLELSSYVLEIPNDCIQHSVKLWLLSTHSRALVNIGKS